MQTRTKGTRRRAPPISLATAMPLSNLDAKTFNPQDAKNITRLAKKLINGFHPGLLNTIGIDGYPRSRWMAAFSSKRFPVFDALTTSDSQKVQEIEKCSRVSWMFFNLDLSLIISLTGIAHIVKDPLLINQVLRRIPDIAIGYFLKYANQTVGLALIETKIESIECNSPKNSLRFPVNLNEIARGPVDQSLQGTS
jgi:general stress protein 26